MKLKYYILILCLTLCNIAFSQQRANGDTITIVVKSDTTISVSEFAPKGKSLYGEHGEKDFREKTKKLNKHAGFSFSIEQSKVYVKVFFPKIAEKSQLSFYLAKEEDDAVRNKKVWVVDEKNKINIIVKKEVQNNIDSSQDSCNRGRNAMSDSAQINGNSDAENGNDGQLIQREENNNSWLSRVLIIIVLFVLLYYIFRIKKECHELKNRIKELETAKKEQTDPRQIGDNQNLHEAPMSKEDMKSFIKECVRDIQTTILQPVSFTVNDLALNKGKKDVEAFCCDTEDVEYQPDDNSFVLEKTNAHIFRIYAKDGKYYYTLVEDSEIRKELAGMIQSYDKCIAYKTTGAEATIIEPICDGILKKEGAKFFVVSKLEVKFV